MPVSIMPGDFHCGLPIADFGFQTPAVARRRIRVGRLNPQSEFRNPQFPRMPSVDALVDRLTRRCEGVTTVAELKERLARGKPMRVKLGMDPTAPDIHMGHVVVLRKLRAFQDAGHKAVLIIGDYTARIGDPSGKSKTRPMLTAEEIDRNADTYLQQAGRVLDLSDPAKYEVRRNSEWLARLSFADVIKLCTTMTVGQMMERETFTQRAKAGEPIGLHEFLYPIMQAYDSVVIEADVELGGTDQTFNLGVGRDMQRTHGQAPQICMVTPLLIGTDGKNKMSKSLGNYIGVTDKPFDMFGKTMRMPDERMRDFFELLTDLPEAEIGALLDDKRTKPNVAKKTLAGMLVEAFHGKAGREAAEKEWHERIEEGKLAADIPEVPIAAAELEGGTIWLPKLLQLAGIVPSTSQGRQAVEGGGVKLNEEVQRDAKAKVAVKTGDVLQLGKRRVVRLRIV
jgi:tyrosyl-tRNA synthetase